MSSAVPLVEIWRGNLLESMHTGHAIICDGAGEIVESWGDPGLVMYPRSSCKMLQAIPLITSGAADAFGLTTEQLALSCASHQGAAIHTDRVSAWLADLELGEPDMRCGPQKPSDTPAYEAMIRADESPCQLHNNCSGKHAGFLTLTKHLGAGPEYLDIAHPLQIAIKDAFEEITGADSPGYGIDGCSAPNHATSLAAFSRSMGLFASAHRRSDSVSDAAVRLREAMMLHPDLVAGETRACTNLMRAVPSVALKTGAEAVFIAIIPELDRGIAVKITDGSSRAAEAVITQLLIRLGLLDAAHPVAQRYVGGPIRNWLGVETGQTRAAACLL